MPSAPGPSRTGAAWTSKDSLLYAIGVGAGAEDPLSELEFTTENSQDVTQRALPTMPVVLGFGGGGVIARIGTFNPVMLVHGEESVTLAREVPPEGEIEVVTEIVGIYDKGSGAVVVTETSANLVSDGQPLFTTRTSMFLRGEGGWGGERGPVEQVRGRPSGTRTTRSPTRPAPTRPCSTACRATATRCTPTPSSRPWPASPGRSSTGCAPTGSPAGPCCTPWPAATPPGSGR